jgi:lipopolysaccharide export system permease protein
MKNIDRYIIRQFLTTSLFALVAVIIIFIVIDAMEKLDDFIDKQASWSTVVEYYFYFIPEIIKLVIPVAVLLASLFVTARMSSMNELAAMKAGGISLYRVMAPYVVVALAISCASVYFNGWVVPKANTKKFAIERGTLKKDVISASGANIFVQDSPTRILSIGFYDESRALASRVSIQDFDPLDPTMMVGRVDARTMSWDSTAERWILHDGVRRWFTPEGERMEQFASQSPGRLHFNPDELRKKQEKPDEMGYYTLRDFIESQKRAGQDIARWEVNFYSKVSFPFATVIVVLFGVPFSSIRRRGGVGVQLGISLLVSFVYLIVMKISQVFGYNGDISPFLTAWLANILFFLGAVAVILRVPK